MAQGKFGMKGRSSQGDVKVTSFFLPKKKPNNDMLSQDFGKTHSQGTRLGSGLSQGSSQNSGHISSQGSNSSSQEFNRGVTRESSILKPLDVIPDKVLENIHRSSSGLFKSNGFEDENLPRAPSPEESYLDGDPISVVDLTQPDSEVGQPMISKREARTGALVQASVVPNSVERTNSGTRKRKVPAWDSMIFNSRPARRAHSTNSQTTEFKGVVKSSKNLTEEQQRVIRVAKARKNLFFTGAAGTGKSFLLKELISQLNSSHRPGAVAVTATTGLAAINVGGQTLHRWAGIGLGKDPVDDLVKRIKKNKKSVSQWQNAAVLIIDEVSMLDGDLFEKLDKIGREIRKFPRVPFGGIQVIVCGDFYQLPPVPDKGRKVSFCFQTKIWQEAIEEQIELTTVFRQEGDQRLINMLSALRQNNLTPEIISQFKALQRPLVYKDGIEPIELYPTKEQVARANKQKLANLKGLSFHFPAKDIVQSGHEFIAKAFFNSLLVDDELTLKLGCQVLFVRNDSENNLVNGSQGRVISFVAQRDMWESLASDSAAFEAYSSCIKNCPAGITLGSYIRQEIGKMQIEDNSIKLLEALATQCDNRSLYPVVDFDGNKQFIEPHEFKLENTAKQPVEVVATRSHLPLILSWALSIHKAQGQTLPRVKMNLTRSFESGQVYVAVSRATCTDSLEIVGFDPRTVRVNEAVREFYNRLKGTGQPI
ncbi:Rrm3p [Sugiyamaella lignohabitans]|uniref:ATP-dependent DNA helicase PIF1 n=1 Tax=Sugiyamaella lignohabitans TaxID=796027 RepID=A0A167DT29_9ASCO|nr:Rrm3p [Sugiyamaella lignohabitans]ANB13261.1 Rrm3p [Sugiyamaella lignohabitans]